MVACVGADGDVVLTGAGLEAVDVLKVHNLCWAQHTHPMIHTHTHARAHEQPRRGVSKQDLAALTFFHALYLALDGGHLEGDPLVQVVDPIHLLPATTRVTPPRVHV
jgi:hypothetical protein